jgi:hypothetical protein
VVAVEFCQRISHLGRCVLKSDTNCCRTASWPVVPGTRGMRRGARRVPFVGS